MSKNKEINYTSKIFLWRQRLGYGVASFGLNIAYIMVNTYLLIFYTDVAGLSTGVAAQLFLLSKIFDAVTDYLVGKYVDRTETKMGKARPWMLAGIPVLAVGMILVFVSPNFSMTGKIIWAYATYNLFSFGYTMINIPGQAILPTLSADAKERTVITTFQSAFGSVGGMVSGSLASILLAMLSNGNMATGYLKVNLIFAAIVIVVVLVCVLSVREINPVEKTVKKANIFDDFKYCILNRAFIVVVIYMFVFNFGYLGMFTSMVYYFTYVIGNPVGVGTAITINTLVGFIGYPIIPILNKKFSKKQIVIMGLCLESVGILLTLISSKLVFVEFVLYGLGIGLVGPCLFSMLADSYVFGSKLAGRSLVGTQSAIMGFFQKVSSAVANACVAALIGLGGYVANAEVQSDSTMGMIKFLFIGIPFITGILSIIDLLFYNLDDNGEILDKQIKKQD